ncbi:MAG TPA: efflux RND transporter permease subunit [Steroidobacteraceae bacterium]|nr:efflux RND transporter permease subunit [Steroidobacteraceae bacterium]
MKNISAWAIRHPVFPLVLFTVLTVYGIVSFVRLPINLNPDISAPFVEVLVFEPGAVPSEMETQIMQKVEGAIAGVGDVKNITSRATEGTAYFSIEFQIGTPVDRALNDVRDAVARVRSLLPSDIQEPVVRRVSIDGGPIAYYSVTTSRFTEQQLSWFVDDTITKRLLAVPGVAQVGRSGGVNRELRVDLDPARMQALDVTAAEVNQQLMMENLDAAGGRAQVAGGEQSIRVLGGADTAQGLSERRIVLGNGRVARLGDLAEVRDGNEEIRSIARLNGRPATTFAVSKSKGASDVTVMAAVQKELQKINDETPGLTLRLVFTTVDYTRTTYSSSMKALIEGALLAIAVVFLFLRNWRATGIAALAIPLAALPTFFIMELAGFTLNQISLLALTLVTGVLVDDAIVEIENISRHMAMGKSAFQAALDAADEIGLAVVATSMTIIAVFMPVSFMGGITGQFFREFGLTISASVFISLLVARLITPLISAYALQPGLHPAAGSPDGPLMAWYLRLLQSCIQHRLRTLLIGLGIFVVSCTGLMLLPKSFVPASDQSSSQLSIELPPGVRLEQTAAVSKRAADIIRAHREVSDVVESIGEDNDGEVRSAQLFITLVPPSQRKLSQQQWEQQTIRELKRIPDARLHFQSQSSGLGRDLSLYVVGSDPALVQKTAEQAVEQMKGLKQLRDPDINGDFKQPEIQIRPRTDLAAEIGVTSASIGETVRIATLGDIAQNSAKFSLSDRQIPIRVSLVESARRDPQTIENLMVRTASGSSVPLKAVADIGFGAGPSKVRRYNQNRRVAIEADLNGVESGTGMQLIRALPVVKHPPAGVRFIEVGDAENMNELFSNFLIAIGAGVLLVFAVLVLLFARLFQPITILSALPLSLGGAALALALTGSSFSLSVVIGILMLMGIVAKNSILLVDFAIEEMRKGRERTAALLESAHKRARPIVMTTVAMVAGMTPVALGVGGAEAFQAPMAICVIGGLLTSTGLTLVIVPAVFTWVDDLERWSARHFRHAVLEGGQAVVPAAQPPH